MSDRFHNQKGLINQDKLAQTKILVIGAGAIGSFFITTLSKMGAKDISVFDFDTLEEHNFDNQLYPRHGIGEPKVEALANVASSYGDCLIKAYNDKWSPGKEDGKYDIVVAAVDDMDVRKMIWEHFRNKCSFYIDGRMAAQFWMVFGVDINNGKAREHYEGALYPQSEASPDPCGQKSIIYTVLGVASEMVAQVKSFIQGDYRPTQVTFDSLNRVHRTVYHMERSVEIVEDVEEVNA